MGRLNSLIDQGAERFGNLTAFADHLEVHPNSLSGYRAGTRPCGLEMHARIALGAGLTETQARDYLWEVVKQRLGKLTELAAVVGLLFIGFIATAFVQPAAAAGPEWTPKSANV